MPTSLIDRINIARFVMVVGVIYLHTLPEVKVGELSDFFSYIDAFFSNGVFRATVPLLTVISSYLLFSSGIQEEPIRLIEKKCKTLLVPLLLWNIPLVVLLFAVQRFGLLSHDFSELLYPFDFYVWVNSVMGIWGPPANYPLSFIRDLFVLSLIAPLFWGVVKRAPYIGFIFVAFVWFFDFDGQLVLRDYMMVNFYLGAFLAVKGVDLRSLDQYWGILFVLFLVCCTVAVFVNTEFLEVFRLISPILIWPLFSLTGNMPCKKKVLGLSKSTFFLFLAHGPIAFCLWILYVNLFGIIPYSIFWLVSPLIIVYVAVTLSTLLSSTSPKIHGVLTGKRVYS